MGILGPAPEIYKHFNTLKSQNFVLTAGLTDSLKTQEESYKICCYDLNWLNIL